MAKKSQEKKASEIEIFCSQSMEKHALVIQVLSGHVISFFAYFNAGIFTAFTAYLATEAGQVALQNATKQCVTVYIFSVLGILLSLALMMSIAQYCNVKFNYYRGVLLDDKKQDLQASRMLPIILITLLVSSTMVSVAFAVLIVLKIG